MKTETIDTLATAGSRTTGGGAVVGFLGWLASSQAIGLLGICIALLGSLVNWYYKHKADARHTREHDLRVDMLRRGRRPDTDLGELGADE